MKKLLVCVCVVLCTASIIFVWYGLKTDCADTAGYVKCGE